MGRTRAPRHVRLVKCRVLPPHFLFHPVLPVRVASKLLFPFCVQCARDQVPLPWTERSHVCDHTPRERAFVGTWCTPELVLALEQGYVILHIYELWNFRQTSTTLFRDYINTWIKVKQDADGWPSPEVEKDPALQVEYLEEFRRVEGVIFDPAKIHRNEGRRTLGKLMANSFWGKFGQRTNKTQVTTCKDPQTFFAIFLDGERDIHRVLPAGEQMIDVYHSYKKDIGDWAPTPTSSWPRSPPPTRASNCTATGCNPCKPASCTWTRTPWCTWPPKARPTCHEDVSWVNSRTN